MLRPLVALLFLAALAPTHSLADSRSLLRNGSFEDAQFLKDGWAAYAWGGATPMFNSFQQTAQITPYQVLTPKVDLLAKNTLKSFGAKQSSRMDFRDYDRAPEDELNRILWGAAKGPGVPYPTPIHRVLFTGSPVSGTEN